VEIRKAVEYLILCTVKHTVIPLLPFDDYKGNETVELLFQEHGSVPRILENMSLTELLLDFDLAILGTSKVEYDIYAEQIRREYSHYTEEEYCRGRIAVLQRFLKRERLYFTDQYYEKYEATARRNIRGEINSLENGLYKTYSQ